MDNDKAILGPFRGYIGVCGAYINTDAACITENQRKCNIKWTFVVM